MKPRKREQATLRKLLRSYPVVAIIGARQVGKSTIAGMLASGRKGRVETFDLEDPDRMRQLAEPMLALKPLRGLVVLDEIQRVPEIFSALRVLADRPRTPCRFLVLGSASPELLRQSSETLAGRVSFHELGGFALDETGDSDFRRLWRRGGMPRSYLARTEEQSFRWRRDFVRTFLERDLPQLGSSIGAETMRRFWSMLAHYHGQVWNASEFGRSFGVADTTVRNYLDRLTGAMVVRQLKPWHENISKRQVKSPKVYILDSGLLHCLLDVQGHRDLDVHPKVGASFEGFAIEQIIRLTKAQPEECYFWATHTGAELDLMIVRGRKRRGYDIKMTSAPVVTKSMRIAVEDLKLTSLDVVHAGDETFPLSKKIRALSIKNLITNC